MKRRIVALLESLCPHRWPLYCKPASWSAKLDQKWKTGHWKEIK